VRLALMIEGQEDVTWEQWLALAAACEEHGIDTLFRSDHYLGISSGERAGSLDAWTLLSALAARTTTLRLGTMVSPVTFRHPSLLARAAVTVDHVSGGRVEIGMGAGWFEREHEAFGLDFGSGFGERLDRLEESVDLIERLLAGERITQAGRFYSMVDAVCEPRPIQARLPILIGGSGREKTLRTTARHADLWNGYGEPEKIAETSAVLRERCAEIGRPFESIERTVTMEVVVRDSPADALDALRVVEAHHEIAERFGSDGSPRGLNAGGPPKDVAAYVRRFADLGVAEVIWVFRSPFDLETMARLADVRAALAG
jgi:F420-dependent oxidoreductase-like protein